MQHLAIMRKSWGMTDKILNGQKTIESRWYKNKNAPWDKIQAGDTVYFKDTGSSVRIKAKASKVMQFADLNPRKVEQLLIRYGKEIGLDDGVSPFYEQIKEKRYGILIQLSEIDRVAPFEIDKSGFGAMSSWISVRSIGEIKKSL